MQSDKPDSVEQLHQGLPTSAFDVLIVGAGMVGLTQALLLAEARPQWRIAVLESRAVASGESSPSFDDRVTALAAASLETLKRLDLALNGATAFADTELQSITQVKVSDRGSFAAVNLDTSLNAGRALGATISNRRLGQLLMATLKCQQNISLLAPAAVKKLVFSADNVGVEVELGAAEPESFQTKLLQTKLLLLADGAESPLARQLGISFSKHDYAQQALIANVEHSKAHQGCAFERFSEDGPLALLPMQSYAGRHRSALVWTRSERAAEQLLHCSEKQFLGQLQRLFAWQLGAFSAVGARHSYPLQRIVADEQWRRRVVLLGNAAHYLHPVAGQGFNLALRDCEELVKQLVAADDRGETLGDSRALSRYIEARSLDQQLTGALSHTFIKAFAAKNPVLKTGRGLGLSLINHCSPLKAMFAAQMMGRGLKLPGGTYAQL
ncbi:FAD-dependent monooxygenase [Agaribacterium haliotis]|uniref:FAD-dependent monooxygenase n=1 Tax=Agaribacterium haliotis TaxID=2013869 RepID=UPI000BB57C04|nr:FAD-dependent monooxygenase [Agaribacterium haliotis]